MAQGNTQANTVQTPTQTHVVLLRECSLVMRVYDSSGNEVKPTTLLVSTTGRFESWRIQGKAIIATIDPFHYEDNYNVIDSYRVKLYCFDGASMRLVGVVFVSNPLDDITSYVRDALSRCRAN
jgi:hypothetical protein